MKNKCNKECDANKQTARNKHQNGKGDKPRNLSERFRENYDSIDWGNRKKKNLESD